MRAIIEERCPDCHVPLHDGRELHYIDYGKGVRPVFRKHRCTATVPVYPPLAPPLPRSA